MSKYFLIAIGLIVFSSCGKNKNDYFIQESKIVNEKVMYNLEMIEKNYMLNPGMAKPYFDRAEYLKTSFDSLLYFIDKENETKMENGIIDLYSFIKSDSYFKSKFIQEIIISNRFNKWIDIDKNSIFSDNEEILKLDLLNLENELTNYLYNRIEADYYKFNKLQAMVVDSCDNIKVGETYHANIFLAAEDTTFYPYIMVADYTQPDSILLLNKPDNERLFLLEAMDGKGIYKKKVSKPGKHGFKGVILIRNSSREIERFMFSKEFTVKQ